MGFQGLCKVTSCGGILHDSRPADNPGQDSAAAPGTEAVPRPSFLIAVSHGWITGFAIRYVGTA